MSIRLSNISKTFGQFQALQPINLELPKGQFTALLGPSGSGKTTLLRIIAGLEHADQGQIFLDQQDVTRQPIKDRQVGLVFQNYALFRHMTVADNIAFGLKLRKLAKAEIHKQVMALLEMVQLPHLAKRYPAQLSGGQKQRVALARALAINPRVLLLDEPFGALDEQVRQELRRSLRQLHDQLGFTSVFVTHDQQEALELSDQVVLMSHGRIEQQGSPKELFERPQSRFAFEFLGHNNLFQGQLQHQRLVQGQAWLQLNATSSATSEQGTVLLRPHELSLANQASEQAHLPMQITAINLVGPQVQIELEPQGWQSDKPWQVGISHQQFHQWQPERGQLCFAVPHLAHFFASHDSPPQSLRFEQLSKSSQLVDERQLAYNSLT